MRLNNKGFAISSIMYLILVMAIIMVSLVLLLLNNRRLILEGQKQSLIKKYEGIIDSGMTYNFEYTGKVQEFKVPMTGYYKVELWGSSGSTYGGSGAYTSGIIKLNKKNVLYVVVGGTDGYNGGRNKDTISDANLKYGGGATDIRLVTNSDVLNFDSLKSRIMVAAGGGSVTNNDGDATSGIGGALTGINGISNSVVKANETNELVYYGSGGTQNSGGSGGTQATSGGFGYGGTYGTYSDGHQGAYGGGGYYGGGGSTWHSGSGGGSSYISGYIGCNSIDQNSTSDNIIHTNSPIHYSGYVFSNPIMISGDNSIPNYSLKGYAKITFIGVDSN